MNCKQITTYVAGHTTLAKEQELPVTWEADEAHHLESGVLNLYPELTFQTLDGFGGAMTESSAYLLSQMDADTRRKALEEYFGPQGNHYHFIRVHMDSCDFSLEEYQAVADPIADPELTTFQIDRDRKYILPVLKEAIALSVEPIQVLLSPWSPPSAWKTPPEKPRNEASVYGGEKGGEPSIDYTKPSRCHGGSLKPEFYTSWARYLCKYVQAYLQEGIPVTMMTLQNESIAATVWDSCVWTPEQQKIFLRDHLYPVFKAAGLTGKIGLYIWDHNKERVYEFSKGIIDEITSPMLEGIAFHWYSGDHFEALELAKKAFPGMKLMSSECCGLHEPGKVNGWSADFKTADTVEYEDAVAYAHDLIGDLNHGMERWIDWNLIVDKNGGPRHVPSGFAAPMVANEDGTYRKVPTFDYIRHFSAYILPGAIRIGFSRCNDAAEFTAFQNKDGSIIVVALNKGTEDAKYTIRMDGKLIRFALPSRTISTLVLS